MSDRERVAHDESELLSLRVLGPLDVRRGHELVDLGPPKQRVVMAALVLARGRIVSTDRLLEMVWGEDLPANATANLQVYLSRLRSLLRDERSGVSPVARRPPGYLLDAGPGRLDTDEFLQLSDRARAAEHAERWQDVLDLTSQAEGLWRGEFLGDLGPAAWRLAEAEVWNARRADTSARHVTALLGLGRSGDAVTAARALLDHRSLRDDVARLAMLALHQAGRTVEALEVYTRHAARLDEELGIEPSRAVREAHVAVLRQEDWAAHWPAGHRGSPEDHRTQLAASSGESPASASAYAAPRAVSLVGRAAEQQVTRTLVDQVVDAPGFGRTLVLTGPAGIGKTRLAEAALAMVSERGGAVARGRCLAEPGAPAWWPLREIARQLGADPDELLSAPAGADADSLRFAVYERLRDLLLLRSSERPLAVLVEDLQWADPTSLQALSYLAAALGSAPILLVATFRTESSAAEVETVTSLLRGEGARHLALTPLAPAAVVELATQVRGAGLDPAEVDALVADTAGNALFVCEYARLSSAQRTAGDVPLAVRGVLGHRVAALGPDALAVLQVAAVLGDPIDLSTVLEVSELDRTAVTAGLDHAVDAAIIELRPGGGYGFTHALLREQVRLGLTRQRRHELHGRAAAVLTAAGSERVSQRAQHLVAAADVVEPRDVIEGCRAAALQAEQRMSSETAVGWWERSRLAFEQLPARDQDLDERDDLTVAMIEAMVRAGHAQRVLDMLDAELEQAVRRGRRSTIGRLAASLLRFAGTWPWAVFGEDPGPLLGRLESVVDFVTPESGPHARVLAAIAVGRCYDPDPRVPDRLSQQAMSLAEATDDPEVLADALIGRVLTYVGEALHAEEAESLLQRVLTLPRRDAAADRVLVSSARTMSALSLGDVAATERHLRAGVAGSDRLRLRHIRAQLRWMEVGLEQWRHGAAAGLAAYGAAVEAHRRTELYDGGFGDLVLRVLYRSEGRLAEVSDFDRVEPLIWAAAGASARGDYARAETLVRSRMTQPFPATWATLAHLMIVTDLVVELSLRDLAADAERLLAPYAGRLVSLGQGPVLGPVDAVRAQLLALDGDHAAARDVLAAARDLCVRNGGHPWVERCDQIAAGPLLNPSGGKRTASGR